MHRVQQLLLLLLFRGPLIDAGEWAVASAQGGLSTQCLPQVSVRGKVLRSSCLVDSA